MADPSILWTIRLQYVRWNWILEVREKFSGDSYDLVKCFFCDALRSLGYVVYIDPMFTIDWSGREQGFFRYLGVSLNAERQASQGLTALLLDPDTGINHKGSLTHVSYERIAAETHEHSLVFAFDQAFSQVGKPGPTLEAKLNALAERTAQRFITPRTHISCLPVESKSSSIAYATVRPMQLPRRAYGCMRMR